MDLVILLFTGERRTDDRPGYEAMIATKEELEEFKGMLSYLKNVKILYL